MAILANPPELRLELPLEAIAELCRKWHISRLEVFGSVVRADFSGNSDIDLLYTFAEGARVGWDIVTMAEDFEQLIGRPVDLISRQAAERSTNWIR